MAKKYPAMLLLMFVVAGILVADMFRIKNYYFVLLLVVFTISALLLLHSRKIKLAMVFLGLSLFCFSGFRFAIGHYDFGLHHVSQFADGKTNYRIYGRITDWVDLKQDRTEFKLSIDSLDAEVRTYPRGCILIKLSTVTTEFQHNDRLILQGRIYPVHNRRATTEFDYNLFLQRKGISGIVYLPTSLDVLIDKGNKYSMYRLVSNVRDMIRTSFYENLSKQSAALASGFLIGETRDIPPELYQQFKDSGTLHLLAVSGSNVVLVLGFFIYLLHPFHLSRQQRSLLLIGIVILFTLLSYNEPSVVRAATMAILVLLAGLFQRRYDLVHVISTAALMILFIAPAQLFNIGFQLSFLIAWGLILAVPKFSLLFEKHHQKKWYRFFILPLFISSVAQIYSFGLVGLYFKQVPLLSPIANLFIVPLVSLLVVGVLLLLVADFLLPLLGLMVGTVLSQLFEFTVHLVSFFGSEDMPFLRMEHLTFIEVLIYYLLVFLLPFAFSNKQFRRSIIILIVIFINLIAVQALIRNIMTSDYFTIGAFSVPGGIAVIVRSPDHSGDIIFSGMEAKAYEIDNKILIPEIKKEGIDSVSKLFLLDSDYKALDDILRLVEYFKVQTIYLSPKLYASFKDMIAEQGTKPECSIRLLYNQKVTSAPGYYPVGNSLLLRLQNANLMVSQKIDLSSLDVSESTHPTYLFVGETWNLSYENWERLRRYNFSAVVCSKTAQEISGESLFLPEYSSNSVFDVYREGAYHLRLKK